MAPPSLHQNFIEQVLQPTRRKRRKTMQMRHTTWLPLLAVGLLLLQALLAGAQQSSTESADQPTNRIKTSGNCPTHTVGQQAPEWSKKVFCFYDIQDDFRPQDLNGCLCTHVVYSYVAVRKNLSFIAGKKGDLRSLASLKRKNPNLKLLVSLRPDDYFSFQTSELANNTWHKTGSSNQQQQTGNGTQMNEMHQKFAKRIRDFVVRHSLDGFNLDWPYFAQTMPSLEHSRQHLSLVLSAINDNFQASLAQSSPSSTYLRLQSPIVTLTVSRDFYSLVSGYDFHQINKLLDFIHLPAFDFDLNVDQFSIGHPARLHGISDAENLDTLVDLLLSSGLPSEQLVAGIPSHGVQITSRAATSASLNSTPGANLDEQLEAAANISIISHSEVCHVRDLVKTNCSRGLNQIAGGSSPCWTMSRARDLTAPYAYDSENWIGFDDETSVKLKAKYVLLRQLAGVAMFTINNDDPAGQCGFGPFPLLATINGVFSRAPLSSQAAATSTPSQRTYFTRAPNQQLTATSLMSQLFGKKLVAGQSTTPIPSGDLMSSASGENQPQPNDSLMSFVDIIEKYGAINRLEEGEFDEQSLDRQLPCERVGYQRYPRDCSRFYRCVQTPPTTPASLLANESTSLSPSARVVASTSTSRLQYECPSGLVFDEQYQICNWPSWSAQCTGSGEVNSITNSKFVCPNYGYFQNQENCEYFYYCSDYNRAQSQAYQFRCPFELGFDEEKLQCNWKWLVKGCNVFTPTNGTNSEMAQKYLQGMQKTAKTIAQNNERVKRSVPRNDDQAGMETRSTPAWGSHLTSILDSIANIREHRMKKAGQVNNNRAANAMVGNKQTQKSDDVTAPATKYPSIVGIPSSSSQTTTTKPNRISSFRNRRRQASPSSESLSDPLPYKRPPPPPSIFPFLPSSFTYQIIDSLRSYGEALQGEVNRYMRMFGDQVRSWIGVRNPLAARHDDMGVMKELLFKLGPAKRWPIRNRSKRDTSDTDDLDALESNSTYVGSSAYPVPVDYQIPNDPLGRPIGYPTNTLDPAAKSAVLGPEPQLYNQPKALVSNQISGISQQDYDQIMKSNREALNIYNPTILMAHGPQQAGRMIPAFQHQSQYSQLHHQQHQVMASASGLNEHYVTAPNDVERDKVINTIVEQARSAFTLSHGHGQQHEQHGQVPFGMPSMVRPARLPNLDNLVPEVEQKKRRSTVAMKLATLAMPRFSLVPTKAPITSIKQEIPNKSKGYRSFLPTLSDVVSAPARSIMNKAMGINKVVQDLISTLSPGSNKNQEPEQAAKVAPIVYQQEHMTTPLPPRPLPIRDFQHPLKLPQNPPPVGSMLNKTLPLLLTEDEARTLNNQLSQMSKEQLEMLSSELYTGEQSKENLQNSPSNRINSKQNDQDYATKLLKMLSKTSHNPEDIKLLDQLVQQLNNPNQQHGDSQIEVGQFDDVRLLEALGIIPANSLSKIMYTEGTHDLPKHQPIRHPLMQHGAMKNLLSQYNQPQGLNKDPYPKSDYRPELVQHPRTQAYPTGPEPYQQPNNKLLYPQPYYTTTTTSTTPAPTQFVTQFVEEQIIERPVPPVKQTFTELVESNVTTPDGIETSFESRVKSSISSGAALNIGSSVGLGMVPVAFGGSTLGQLTSDQQTSSDSSSENIQQAKIDVGTKGSSQSTDRKSISENINSGSGISSFSGLSGLSSGQFSTGDKSGGFGGRNVGSTKSTNGYNFATQPVNQFEEVVIKKKFKPFPKQVIVPQTSQFTIEEVRNEGTQAPTVVQESNSVQSGTQNSGLVSSFGGSSFVANRDQVIKDEDIGTTMASFGESLNAGSSFNTDISNKASINEQSGALSLTRQELQQSQKLEEQRQIQNLQLLLDQQLQQQEQQQQLNSSQIEQIAPFPNFGSSSEVQANITESEIEINQADNQSAQAVGSSSETESSRSEPEKKPKTKTKKPKNRRRKKQNSKSQTTIAPTTEAEVETGTEFTTNTMELKRSPKSIESKNDTESVESSASDEFRLRESASKKKQRKSRSKKVSEDRRQNDKKSTESGSNQFLSEQVAWERSKLMARVQPESGKDKAKAKKKASNKQSSSRRKSRGSKKRQQDLAASASTPKKDNQSRASRRLTGSSSPSSRAMILPVWADGEQVTVYGTKSGFLPIIGANDPSYSTQLGHSSDPETLKSSASFVIPKHQGSTIDMSLTDDKPESESMVDKDLSWGNFVRRLNNQISVVKLGNYTEKQQPNGERRLIQVKLVILPASPNNQLLNPTNWNFLSAYYPQLFPSDRSQLSIGPIDLGRNSIAPTSGLIDEHLEEFRYQKFKQQFEPISALIEQLTFKALDEIVQRSSGRLFMMQEEGSRTIVAVIPDKPLIVVQETGSHYQRQIPTVRRDPQDDKLAMISTLSTPSNDSSLAESSITTATPIINKPTRTSASAIDQQVPKKVPTFSQAIQESVQAAIKQHYNTMKTKLKQSMSEPALDETDRLWLKPSSEVLAHMESVNLADISQLDTSSSSTEYSVAKPEGKPSTVSDGLNNKQTANLNGNNYTSHSIYEVDGAEPKSLYGLDMNSQRAEQDIYFAGAKQHADDTRQPLDTVTVSPESRRVHSTTPSARFISIGSHLMASPMKLPKVVDQAYVNHFYDHISEHQLAKAAGFEEAAGEPTSEKLDTAKQQQDTTNPSTSLSEDSLVPESACTRAGLFQHPFACNKFYECFWDKQLSKYTLHMFECPIKLAFDDRIVGCAMPIESSLCVNY